MNEESNAQINQRTTDPVSHRAPQDDTADVRLAPTAAAPPEIPQPFTEASSVARLAEAHRAHLHASGLNDDTIRKLGFYTCDDAVGRDLLNWKESRPGSAAGLVVPYPNVPGYAKVRFDTPPPPPGAKVRKQFDDHQYLQHERPQADSSGYKYGAPVGSEPHVYIPRDLCPGIDDPDVSLTVIEGEKKAVLLCQEGQAAVSIPGVSNGHDVEYRRWAQDHGEDEWKLHPELVPLVTPGREVCILFDTPDMEENIAVIRAAVRLARMIDKAGGKPVIGYVPNVGRAPGMKVGVDDYFVAMKQTYEAMGSHTFENILRCDFARARPVHPHALLDWLKEQRAENGWKPDQLQPFLQKAAIWTRIWHEDDLRKFTAWTRRAAKELFVSEEDILKSVEHLPLHRGGKNGNEASDFVREECVPVLNERYTILRRPDGTATLLGVSQSREATRLENDEPLKQYMYNHLKERYGRPPPEKMLASIITVWKRECRGTTEDPAPFGFDDDQRLCTKRFNWRPSPGLHPAWDEFTARLSDPEAFKAFVWSIVEMKSKSRQFVWLRGEGQDGKTQVIRALMYLLGPAAIGISNAMLKETRFFNSAIYGKRLVTYGDCKNTRFGMTELVRNMTSGDYVSVEFKGETPFNYEARVKLIVASNSPPEATSQKADQSRMILLEVDASKNKDDPTWGERLKEELPAFLYTCQKVYERVCPHHGDIPVNDVTKALREEAALAFEEEFQLVFESNFEMKLGSEAKAEDVAKRLRQFKFDNNKQADFKQWMARVHGVVAARRNTTRLYRNLVVKPTPLDLLM